MGSGVAGALRRANGEEINRDAVKRGRSIWVRLPSEASRAGDPVRNIGAAFGSVSRRDRPPTI